MPSATLRSLFFVACSASVAVAVACSGSSSDGSSPATTPPTEAAAPEPPAEASPGTEAGPPDAGPPQAVTFSYTPSWKGVKTVEVYGAFGQGTDWTAPFVTLADAAATGTFTATSPALPSGQYAYVFKVTGDEAAAMPSKLVHYAVDPSLSAFVACPVGAPTYSKTVANPCSQLTIPAPAASAIAHVHGSVVSSGTPIAGYLVVIERDEPKSHHMFVDRMTTGADGTFDLAVAAGSYRAQVLHPTFYAMTDVQRTSPETLAAVRRTISSSIVIDADTTLEPAEVAYGGYAAMEPRGLATLPTTFTFTVAAGAKARAAVYGPGASIGDPWWVAPLGTTGTAVFDGGFDTAQANDAGLLPDAHYAWGTEQQYPKTAGARVSWTAQSMVFPIQWP
jgi:hypothetical protein